MKRAVMIAVILSAAVASGAQAPQTEEQKTFYSLGLALGRDLSMFDLSPAEAEMVSAGFKDSVAGKKPATELEAYAPKISALARSRADAKTKRFLDKAAAEKGAAKSKSGLIFTETSKGKGASPKETDTVRVHYHGTLIDGTVFDSSVRRGQPAEFPLNAVIPCWTEGLQKMRIGGKAKLVCPAPIAYGENGRPPVIPGGATLIFDVELLEIKKG